MYFIGAATDTTMLWSGKLSMRAFRRLSYSSDGIPGISSLGLTVRKFIVDEFPKNTVMWLTGPTEVGMGLKNWLAIY
jgi:hypothetical protein